MKKGFTLVELIVSFGIISILSLTLFKTVISLSQSQKEDVQYNSYIAFTSVLNNIIQSDFTTYRIISIKKYNSKKYGIYYEKIGEVILETDDDYIIYNNTKEKIPVGYTMYDDIYFSNYISKGEGFDSYIMLHIPIKNDSSVVVDELKYIYQVDSNKTLIPSINE